MSYLVVVTLVTLAFASHDVCPDTWYVDDDNFPGPGSGSQEDPFCSIQAGISAAASGDTVLVLPGTYVENRDFVGKAITVRSDDDGIAGTHAIAPDTTIIDGNDAGSVVVLQSAEGRDSVLEGFCITNGLATNGSGVCCLGTSPRILSNKIESNGETDGIAVYGGGVFCNGGGSPEIRANRIQHNWVDDCGAGVCCEAAAAQIVENLITYNRTYDDGAAACLPAVQRSL